MTTRDSGLDLLYFRPPGAFSPLDERVRELCARYPIVRLRRRFTAESGYLFGGWVSETQPTLLLIREQRCVAQAVGDVPLWALERLLRNCDRQPAEFVPAPALAQAGAQRT